MRDRRFLAEHRGGPLTLEAHRTLAMWAADCAEHVLSSFAEESADERPLHAIATARAWTRAEVTVGEARKAAIAAHAAARSVHQPSAIAAARAAAHAAATAHMADHALRAASYARKAVVAPELELTWQLENLPRELHPLVRSALANRTP